jgi:hypothetical protein
VLEICVAEWLCEGSGFADTATVLHWIIFLWMYIHKPPVAYTAVSTTLFAVWISPLWSYCIGISALLDFLSVFQSCRQFWWGHSLLIKLKCWLIVMECCVVWHISTNVNVCCLLQCNGNTCHFIIFNTVSVFNFGCMAEVIKSTSINVSLMFATSVADARGLQLLQGIGFYFTLLFMVFLPQILVACLHHCVLSCSLL